jgi:hypothetical protein
MPVHFPLHVTPALCLQAFIVAASHKQYKRFCIKILQFWPCGLCGAALQCEGRSAWDRSCPVPYWGKAPFCALVMRLLTCWQRHRRASCVNYKEQVI